MGIEIERKFLVTGTGWRETVERSRRLVQAYLSGDDGPSVRIRIVGGPETEAILGIKAGGTAITRQEFEYPIPLEDAETLVEDICRGGRVEKTRHYLHHGDHLWEVDEFEGANRGLVLAEIELQSEDEAFEHPPWLGEEVSDDPRYLNVRLARYPYGGW